MKNTDRIFVKNKENLLIVGFPAGYSIVLYV